MNGTRSIMYHKLLEKQIQKLLPPSYQEDEVLKAFLLKISSTYGTFERDKEISEHAFAVSEKEYQEVTSNLSLQNNIRRQSFIKLKNAIHSLDPSANFDINDDDLINVISYLENEIQKKKELQEELIKAKEVAEKASAAKSFFLANMSHEIRTPLNGIVGMIELALHTNLTAEQKRYLEIIKSSSDILMNVINDILDFSKIDAGKLDLHPYPFSLRHDIAKSLKPIGLKASEKELEFVLRIHKDVPDLYIADALRIQQVILNLLNNAVKFTEKGQIIFDIKSEYVDAKKVCLHFTVEDTGIGIEGDKLEGIFGEFIQADNSANRKFTGTGLGLAISKKLVEMMGGEIWVESELNKGSTFGFTLPLQLQDASFEQRFLVNDAVKNTTVLVAEGNEAHRNYTIEMLSHFGVNSIGFSHGEDILEELKNGIKKKKAYPVVLLDINLAGKMNGIEVAKKIRATRILKKTKIIIISMSYMAYDREVLSRLGISEFFTKPFSHSDLLDAIQNTMLQDFDTKTVISRKNLVAIQKTDQTPKNILLVEDNLVNQEVAQSMLKSLGHHVTIANNGAEAVAMVEEKSFDIILMDVQMPLLNGYEATKKIREIEHSKGTRNFIVGLTANAMNGDRQKCIEAGMDDYLTKPLHFNALTDAIMKNSKEQTVSRSKVQSDEVLIDFESLSRKLMGSTTHLKRCIELLKKDTPFALSQLSKSLHNKDWKVFKDECHSLKGMLLTMEMKAAASLSSRIEELAKEKNQTDIEPLLEQLILKINGAVVQLEANVLAEEAVV